MAHGAFYLHTPSVATLAYSINTADMSRAKDGVAPIVSKPATRKHEGAQDTATLSAFASKVLGFAVEVRGTGDVLSVEDPKPAAKNK